MSENKRLSWTIHFLTRGPFLLSLLLSVLVMVSTVLCYHQGFLRPIDHMLYDFHFRWRGPIPTGEKIVLVLMDDRSAIELGKKKGDWSRKDTARALENLCAAGAEIIGIDLVMSAADPDPDSDLQLANVINSCNNIVMPRVAATQSGESLAALELFQEGIIGEGFIDVQLDSDGIWRRMNYFNVGLLPDGTMAVFPAFALELVRTFLLIDATVNEKNAAFIQVGNPSGPHIKLPRPYLLINFHGDYRAFESISFSDVVFNRFDPGLVDGKLILMGSSLAVNKDKFLTPLSTFHSLDDSLKDKFRILANQGFSQKDLGVACIAHAAETMLEGRMIRPLSKTIEILLIFLLGGLCLVFYDSRLNMMTGFLILGVLLSVVMGSRFVSFAWYHVVFDSAPLLMVTVAQFITGGIFQKSVAHKKAARVTHLFGRYVSKSVVNELVQSDVDVHFTGAQKDLTILFSDLRNFTGLSEKLTPKEITILLNTYFGAMIPLVLKHKGTLDKLVGDMIMAFFGAPLPVSDHPIAAAGCALEMQRALRIFRENHAVKGADSLWAGIGINTGPVIVGNLGSEDFIDYTVIGDTVNIASRLEGLNKVYGTQIIISESIKNELKNQFLVRKLDKVRVRGKHAAVIIYELMGELSRATQDQKDRAALFESGLDAFQCADFDRAGAIFQNVLTRFEDDNPSKLYLERIAVFQQVPPREDWDGVTILDHK